MDTATESASREFTKKNLSQHFSDPKLLKFLVDLPLRMALYPAGWDFGAPSEGQDLYVVAQPKLEPPRR